MNPISKHFRNIIIILLVISMLPLPVIASESSGTLSETIAWKYDNDTGSLTIYGEGAMPDFRQGTDAEGNLLAVSTPWYSFSSEITSVTIKKGITGIGAYTFFDCSSLSSVSIPTSISTIGEFSFTNCSNLQEVHYPGSAIFWSFITVEDGNESLMEAELHFLPTEFTEGLVFDCYTCTEGGTVEQIQPEYTNYTSDSSDLSSADGYVVPQWSYTYTCEAEENNDHSYFIRMKSLILEDSHYSIDAYDYQAYTQYMQQETHESPLQPINYALLLDETQPNSTGFGLDSEKKGQFILFYFYDDEPVSSLIVNFSLELLVPPDSESTDPSDPFEPTFPDDIFIPDIEIGEGLDGELVGSSVTISNSQFDDLIPGGGKSNNTIEGDYTQPTEPTEQEQPTEPETPTETEKPTEPEYVLDYNYFDVLNVINLIDDLPANITLNDEAAIENARSEYQMLSGSEKLDITNYDKLIAAETTLEAVKADHTAAQAVISLINNIPDNISLADKQSVVDARTAYTKLTDTQKKIVTNYIDLQTAEATISALEQKEKDKTAANQVISLIANIPENVTLLDQQAVKTARSRYNQLTDAQKSLVSNYKKLTDTEDTINYLEDEYNRNKSAAAPVEALIEALPIAVTLHDKDNVTTARIAYNALTAQQKAYVSNYPKLTEAEKKITALEKQEALEMQDELEHQEALENSFLTLVGIIIDENGKPLSDINVSIYSDMQSAITDPNGSFQFNHVQFGSKVIELTDSANNLVCQKEFSIDFGSPVYISEDTVFAENADTVTLTMQVINNELVFVNVQDGNHALVIMNFVDVAPNSWYYPHVEYAYQHWLMNGISDIKFGPNETASRAMIATVLYRIAGRPEVTASSPFTDVKSNSWYAEAVTWAANEGIVNGYGNGKFGPNDPITREQTAVLLYRFAAYSGNDVSTANPDTSFTDYDTISKYAREALAWAVEKDLYSGYPDGSLKPKDTATRAVIATVLHRYCEYILSNS